MGRLTFTDLTTFKGTKVWESETNLHGQQSVGTFRIESIYDYFYLFSITDEERNFFSYVKLGKNEKLFRYETETTRIGRMQPLIKVNMKSGLVYFLKDSNGPITVFEKISSKPIFIDININQQTS